MPERPNATDSPDGTDDPDAVDDGGPDEDDRPKDDRPEDDQPGDDHASEEPSPREREDTPPPAVIDEAERLTRLARDAVDDSEAAAYRTDRDERLADHDYTARVREDETRDVLVCHPDEWIEDGTIRTERVEAIERGIEIPLSGPGEGDDWAEIDAHNRELVADVREEYGDPHGETAAALADFMGNHYAKPIESATRGELAEFLTEYFPRNAWPTDEQRAVAKKSVRIAFDVADERCPLD